METARWALFPRATPPLPTALRVYRASTAALLACRYPLATVRLQHFPVVAPAQNHAHRVHWALLMQSAELRRALSVLPGIFRTVRVRAHACSATQVHSAAAQASLLSAAAVLQDRSPLVAPLRQRHARPAPQASTVQL